MKYQLVVQWPATSIKDYDAMVEVEDMLIERLTELHEIDGHDVGSGEVKAALKGRGLWVDARVAYREIDKSEYTVLWPKGLNEFSVTSCVVVPT